MKSFFKNILSTVIGMLIASFVSLIIIAGLIAVIFQTAMHGSMATIDKDSILHFRLRGQIVDKHRPLDFELFGDRSIFKEDRTVGLWELSRSIDAAKKDDRIDGIYLELRDLDGGWATLTALHDKILEFRKTGKWVYAYADHYSNKAYYLATSADKIFIQPSGELDFNGLSLSEPFVKGLLDKLDIEARVFRVGKFKAAVEPLILEKMSQENRKQNEELLGDTWAQIRKATALNQKLDEKRVDEIAANLLAVSAVDAKKVGLVTDTMFEDQVEDTMKDLTIFKNKKNKKVSEKAPGQASEKTKEKDEKDEKDDKDDDLRFVSAGQLLHDSRSQEALKGKGKKKIAVIFAEGEIGSGEGGRDSIGSESFREDLMDAREDEDVAAIVVRINSPGGDALASDVIWREMMVTDQQVPVVISMGDVAASGGYYMASAGRYIFAEPTTITGSIGVFGLMFNTEKFFKNKVAVHFESVVTHPHADIGDSNRPMTPFESNQIQSEVNRTYNRFLDVVQEGRGFEKREDLESIAEGRVWSGTRALDIGLVDELGGLDQALKKAAEFAELKDYQVEIFPRDSDPFVSFVERFSGDSVESFVGPKMLAKLRLFDRVVDRVVDQASLVPFMSKPGVYTRMIRDVNIH
jgi:protease-4